jgi:hypothetical protein
MTLTCPSLVRKKALKAQLTMEMRIAPKNALQKPGTSNPGTTPPTIHNISAFTMRMKRPRVNTISGRLSRSSTGRIIAFTIPRSKEAPRSDPQLSTWIPVNCVVIATAIVVTSHRIRKGFMNKRYRNAVRNAKSFIYAKISLL